VSGRARAALFGAYAGATFLAFPQPLAGRVLDLGLACGWLAPACLCAGLAGLPPRRAAAAGFAAGLAAHAGVLHWLWVVTVVYGQAPALAGLAAPFGLGAYIAAFTALFGAGAAWLARSGSASPFALALWWTALDHLRSGALSGFPWATLGYSQHTNAALLPLTAYTGVYGLSFLCALGGAALPGLARALRGRERPAAGVVAALAVVAAAHAAGPALRPPPDGPARVRVGVLQGNIDQGVKWSPAFAEEALSIYEELSREAVRRGARLVVWPETAVPGSLETDPGLRARLAALARETGASFVVGGVGIDRDPATGGPLYHDSAYLLSAGEGFLGRYDKSHLVPFGEYVPLRDLLGRFLSAVARGIASGDVTAGPGPRAVALPLPGGDPPAVRAGVPICYELIFPDLVRRFVRDGAELLLGITNDAWYGRTGAPHQFLAITALRSAENRVWTARAANTGVSAIIDAGGRVRAATRVFERDLLVADVPLRPAPAGGSFYARRGDCFAGACWIGSGLAALLALRARRRGAGIPEGGRA
jgi:apolipoprotein N-acyltransferase